jgi:hypothetical protein
VKRQATIQFKNRRNPLLTSVQLLANKQTTNRTQ